MKFLPKNWILIPLGDCCQIISGSTPKRNKPEYWGGDIPWVTPKDLGKLKTPVLKDAPEKITEAGYKSCSTTLLPQGSILFSSRAPIGYVAIAGRPMCTNQGFKSLVPNEYVHSPYLYWCMRKYASDIEALGSGTTFKEVSKGIVERFIIPLPPLEEQRRIAAILDKADGVRRKRKEAIRLTEELLKSTFLEMFGDPVTNPKGWEIVKIENIIELVSGQVDPRESPYSNMLHVGGDNIESGTGEISGCKTPAELSLISGKYLFRKGDILYSKIRPYLNKVSLPDFDGVCSADIYPIRVNHSCVTPIYMTSILRSKGFLEYAEKHSTRTNIPKINRKALLSFECPLPPLGLQNQFTNSANKILKIKDHEKTGVDKANNLFNSLLQRAFRGEL